MNYQETLNKSYLGIIEQGGPSIDKNCSCLYRSPQGRKCAIGQLISDEQYTEDLDQGISPGVGFNNEINNILINNGYTDLFFLSRLQKCHDEAAHKAFGDIELFFEIFNRRINELATEYELEVPQTSSI